MVKVLTLETISNINDKYTVVLGSPVGQDVLADILVNLCHFGCTLDPDNRVQVAEYNVGVAIMARMGIYGPNKLNEVVRALCGVAPRTREV